MDRAAATAGIKLQSYHEIDVYGTLKASVSAGLGFTMLPFGALLAEIGRDRLFIAELVEPKVECNLSMAFACNKAASTLTREFAKHIRTGIKGFAAAQAEALRAFT